MHMARLADPSSGPGQYSLQSLSNFYERDIIAVKEHKIKTLLEKSNLDENSK
jgi:hypothetical protein